MSLSSIAELDYEQYSNMYEKYKSSISTTAELLKLNDYRVQLADLQRELDRLKITAFIGDRDLSSVQQQLIDDINFLKKQVGGKKRKWHSKTKK